MSLATLRTSRRLAACLAVAGLFSFAAKQASAASDLTHKDRDYLKQLMEETVGEEQVSRLARTEAKHADVKDFAEKMVQGHEKMEKELRDFADRHGESLPGNDEYATAATDRLAHLKSAKEFEKEYLSDQVRDHEEMLKLLHKVADDADEKGLKDWSAEKAKVVETHQDEVKDLDKKYNK